MKKSHKEMRKEIEYYYPSANKLELDDFFRLIGESDVPFVVWDRQVLIPAVILTKITNRHRADYAANWAHSERPLRGKHFRIEGEKDKKRFKQLLLDRFPQQTKLRVSSTTWFLNWERAYDYVSRSLESLTTTGFNDSKEKTKVVFDNGILYISSFELATQLEINHRSITKLLKIYSENLEFFGPLIERKHSRLSKKKGLIYSTYYMLNEDQAYLLGTLSRNSSRAIQFKIWLVNQFAKARKLLAGIEGSRESEQVIHSQIAELSLYTSLEVQVEFPLPVQYYHGNKLVNSTKRVDILLNRSVAIELKYEKLTVDHITDTIGSRGYFHSLKKFSSFKYLILSSPAGITHNALKMMEVMYPKVIFLYPHQIGDKIASLALKEYPPNSHWWLKKLVFPKFSRILSKDFMNSIHDDRKEDSKSLTSSLK